MKKIIFCLLFVPTLLWAKPYRITLVFTGGMKGVLPPQKDNWGGFARRYTLIQTLKQQAQKKGQIFLALDSGNTLAPFYLSRFDQGKLILQAMKELGYVAISPGNQEFSYGREYFLKRLTTPPYFLASNLYQGKKRLGKAYLLLKRQGIRIAIFGLLSPRIQKEVPASLLKRWTLRPPIEEAKKLVSHLKNKAHLIFCIGFLNPLEAAELAEQVPSLHLVIRSYHHSFYKKGKQIFRFQQSSFPVILAPPRNNRSIGVAYLTLNEEKKLTQVEVEHLPLSPSLSPHPEIEKKIQLLKDQLTEKLGRELLPFPPAEAFPIPLKRRDFATLLAFILRKVLHTEVAVINQRVIRKEVLEEWVTKGGLEYIDLERLFYTSAKVCVVTMKGKDLAELIKKPNSREPLAFAGLTIKKGKVFVNGVSLRPGDLYWVATVQYLASGNTGYPSFQRKSKIWRTFEIDENLELSQSETGVEIGLGEILAIYFRKKMEELKGMPYSSLFKSHLQRLLKEEPPTYILFFDNLRLTYALTKVNAASHLASTVPDTRASAKNEETLGVGGSLHFIRLSSALLWENKAYFIFAQSKIEGQERNTSQDDFYLSSDFSFLSLGFPLWLFRMLPYMDLKYDTELERDKGKPRESILYFSLGAAGISPTPFSKFKIGALGKADFTGGKNTVQYGFLFQLEYHQKFFSHVKVDSGFLLYYFPDQQEDKPGDLRLRLEWNTLVATPLWRGISLVVELRIFVFQAKEVPSPTSGNHIVLSVGIAYNRIWKFLYEPFVGGG